MIFRSRWLFATTLLLAQIGSTPTVAQISHPTTPPANLIADVPPPAWGKDLNLTTEQRTQLKAIRDRSGKNSELVRQKMMTAQRKMGSLLQSTASISQLRQQYQEVQQLRQQLDLNEFEALLSERQILTPEQLTMAIQKFQRKP
jgi:Spy/CpxP family protein refolding chaperone